jgi:DNA polymerase III delta prime subunit
MSDAIWTEKYRPKTISEYYMNKNQLDKVKEWITDLRGEDANEAKPFLILYGTAGVGKTTLAHLILQKYGYEVIECNASDTRSKKQIRDVLGGISSISVCVDSKNNFKKTAIIMDEVDGLNGTTESSGIQELIDIIITGNKKTKEAKWVCPVICTSNNIKDKKMQLLLRQAIILHIDRPTNNDILKLISRITKSEGFEIDNDKRYSIIKKANGDYRQIILLLYDYYNDLKLGSSRIGENQNINIEKIEKNEHQEADELRQTQIRNIDSCGETPLDKINFFLTHPTDLDIIRYFCSGDSNLYFMNFYYNIIPILQFIQEKMKEPKNKDTFLKAYRQLVRVYESIKNADLMNNSIFLDKNWELLDYFDIFSVGAPSHLIYNLNNLTNLNSANSVNSANSANLLVKEFPLSHHSAYNFMRQEQSMNKKLINVDYVKTFDTDIANIYYNLRRFQNNNDEMIKKYSKLKKKPTSPGEAKYVLDKSYLKIIDKINELLS